jgi:hypothetical protein
MRGVPALALLVAGAIMGSTPHRGEAQQPGVVLAGTALDSVLQPLPDVIVRLLDVEVVSRTDSAGRFRLEAIPAGHHTLSLQKPGFAPQSLGFDLTEAQQGEIDVGAIPLRAAAPPRLTLRGTLTDAQTGEPVAGVAVWVNGGLIGETVEDGSLQATPTEVLWGANELELRRIGYLPQSLRFWVVEPDAEMMFEDFTLQALPILLPEVVVLGERTVLASPRVAGFYRRMRGGFGTFITKQEVEAMNATYLSDVLRRVPGLMVGPSGRLGSVSVQSMRGLGRCASPIIYLDGHRIDNLVLDLDLDAWVHPEEILGIEVYRGPSELPPEFNRATSGGGEMLFGTGCGAIVIWTG